MSFWRGTNVPKSRANAFDWRSMTGHVDFKEKTARQRLLDATRENPESTLDKRPLDTAAKQARLKKGRSI